MGERGPIPGWRTGPNPTQKELIAQALQYGVGVTNLPSEFSRPDVDLLSEKAGEMATFPAEAATEKAAEALLENAKDIVVTRGFSVQSTNGPVQVADGGKWVVSIMVGF